MKIYNQNTLVSLYNILNTVNLNYNLYICNAEVL